MKEETFKKAVQISQRIDELERFRNDLKPSSQYRLWYAHNSGEFGSEWRLTAKWRMEIISAILDKHDELIRQEVDDEIERLKKEIEAL